MYKKPTRTQEFEKKTLKEALNKNPFIKKNDLAKELGCSERTVYRLLNAYNIISKKPKQTKEQVCVSYLKSIGYQFD